MAEETAVVLGKAIVSSPDGALRKAFEALREGDMFEYVGRRDIRHTCLVKFAHDDRPNRVLKCLRIGNDTGCMSGAVIEEFPLMLGDIAELKVIERGVTERLFWYFAMLFAEKSCKVAELVREATNDLRGASGLLTRVHET